MTRGLAPKTIKMLDTAYMFIESVDYQVSLRWLFYRLMNVLGLVKEDYPVFVRAASKARKKELRGWHPSIIADETRSIYNPNTGFSSLAQWASAVKKGIRCNLDKHSTQRNNLIVCFEASAMMEQFKKYTGPYYVPLVPFRGDASIPLKIQVADLISELAGSGKPVTVLYFGDLDPKGRQIPKSAMADIRKWAEAEFNFIRVGLNEEHVSEYSLLENPMKPGEYQWEALEDEAAAYLIMDSLNGLLDITQIETIRAVEKQAELLITEYLSLWDPLPLLSEFDLGAGDQ